jgi:GR25 family glycosyltransferase involved in LPS biosynthesis
MNNSIMLRLIMQKFDIYILGVKEKYRGKELEHMLSEKELIFHNIWGIDATVTPIEGIPVAAPKWLCKLYFGLSLTGGELACLELHLRTYETFSKSRNSWALVLEDDSYFASFDLDLMSRAFEEISNAAIVQLHRNKTRLKSSSLLKENEGIKYFLNSHFGMAPGTYAYLVNKSAVDIILKACRKRLFVNVADWPIQWRHEVNAFSLSPAIATERGHSPSIIAMSGRQNDHFFGRKFEIRYALRRLLLILSGVLPAAFLLVGISPKALYKDLLVYANNNHYRFPSNLNFLKIHGRSRKI